MTYADWFERVARNDQKEKAREYLQKFVTNAGAKDGRRHYVKAANDKLYALSGSVAPARPDRPRERPAVGRQGAARAPVATGTYRRGRRRPDPCETVQSAQMSMRASVSFERRGPRVV